MLKYWHKEKSHLSTKQLKSSLLSDVFVGTQNTKRQEKSLETKQLLAKNNISGQILLYVGRQKKFSAIQRLGKYFP